MENVTVPNYLLKVAELETEVAWNNTMGKSKDVIQQNAARPTEAAGFRRRFLHAGWQRSHLVLPVSTKECP